MQSFSSALIPITVFGIVATMAACGDESSNNNNLNEEAFSPSVCYGEDNCKWEVVDNLCIATCADGFVWQSPQDNENYICVPKSEQVNCTFDAFHLGSPICNAGHSSANGDYPMCTDDVDRFIECSFDGYGGTDDPKHCVCFEKGAEVASFEFTGEYCPVSGNIDTYLEHCGWSNIQDGHRPEKPCGRVPVIPET